MPPRPARLDPQHQPTIRTRRLVLRPIDLVADANDRVVASMTATIPYPYRQSDAECFVDAVRRHSWRRMVSAVTLGDRLIGTAGINAIPRRAELGYWIARSHRGRGYATEATRALLAYGFVVLRLPLVRSGVFVDNPASLRVQTKHGFRRVGFGTRYSLGRGGRAAHIDTVLPRERFLAARP